LVCFLYVGVKFRAAANPVPSRTSHNAIIEVLLDCHSGAYSCWYPPFHLSVCFITWIEQTKPIWSSSLQATKGTGITNILMMVVAFDSYLV
jgi:hypothetical protein